MALKPNIKSPIDAGQRAALFAALLLTISLKERDYEEKSVNIDLL